MRFGFECFLKPSQVNLTTGPTMKMNGPPFRTRNIQTRNVFSPHSLHSRMSLSRSNVQRNLPQRLYVPCYHLAWLNVPLLKTHRTMLWIRLKLPHHKLLAHPFRLILVMLVSNDSRTTLISLSLLVLIQHQDEATTTDATRTTTVVVGIAPTITSRMHILSISTGPNTSSSLMFEGPNEWSNRNI